MDRGAVKDNRPVPHHASRVERSSFLVFSRSSNPWRSPRSAPAAVSPRTNPLLSRRRRYWRGLTGAASGSDGWRRSRFSYRIAKAMPSSANDPRREARALSRFSHLNICAPYKVGTKGDGLGSWSFSRVKPCRKRSNVDHFPSSVFSECLQIASAPRLLVVTSSRAITTPLTLVVDWRS